MDRSLRFQQSIEGRRIALLVLRAKSNDLADLEPLVPGILAALESITPGTVTTVPAVSMEGG